jgi:GntR family transcriptional regulator / MocR family aminotransferase
VPGPAAAGMHVALHLPAGTDDRVLSTRARQIGLAVPLLSAYYQGPGSPGLLVHYGNVPVDVMPTAVARLGEVLRARR